MYCIALQNVSGKLSPKNVRDAYPTQLMIFNYYILLQTQCRH